jgi:hypothetical protein
LGEGLIKGGFLMRAFSSKKYQEPKVIGTSVILVSVDGSTEVRVQEPIKYIDSSNNSRIFRPEVALVRQLERV